MYNKTPASRKFVPPSSTSSSRPKFSSRFLRGSQTPSSPYTRTPLSSTRQRDLDSISDGVASDDDEIELPGPNSTAPKQTQEWPRDDQFPPSQAASIKKRKTSHYLPSREIIYDEQENASLCEESHLESRNKAAVDDTVLVPHSSPEASDLETNVQPAPVIHTSHQLHTSSSPTSHSPPQPFATPKNRISRFRHPTQPFSSTNPAQTQDQPFPSFQSRLLASASAVQRGPHPALDFTLPDAFSPSRKKGQKAYIHGGHAETVRGWIFDIAARAGQSPSPAVQGLPATQDERPDAEHEQHFTLGKVMIRDRDRRFALVKAVYRDVIPGDEVHLMLIDSDSRHSRRNAAVSSKLDLLHTGCSIVVRARSTAWTLQLPLVARGDMENIEKGNKGERTEFLVAVIWDVLL